MDLKNIASFLQNEPVGLALIAVLLATIVFAVVLPVLTNLIHLPALDSLIKLIKRHPIRSLAALALVLLLIACGTYLFYKDKPVLVSAKTLTSKEAGELIKYANAKTTADIESQKVSLTIIDLRPSSEYLTAHVKGSANLDLTQVMARPFKGKDRIVVYASANDQVTAKKAAEYLAKTYKLRVYLVKDGFEGLEAAGLKLVKNSYRTLGEEI